MTKDEVMQLLEVALLHPTTDSVLVDFARLIAARQREKDSEICLDQKYMVLQPTRIYTAYDICNAQKSAAEHLARAIRAQGEE